MQNSNRQKLTSVEQQALRARAHSLNPVVMISEKGLSDNLLKEIDRSLSAHELIKIRVFGDDKAQRAQAMEAICSSVGAVPVQHIGKILVVYRKNPDHPAKRAPAAKPVNKRAAQEKPATARRRKA